MFRDRDCGVCSIAGILAHIRQAADPSAVRFTCICLAVPLHVLLAFGIVFAARVFTSGGAGKFAVGGNIHLIISMLLLVE